MQQTREMRSAGPALALVGALIALTSACTIDIQNKKGADPCDPNPCEKQGACEQWTATCTVKGSAAVCSNWKAKAGSSPVDAQGKALSAPAAYEAIETLCDGIDNDCDGLVDEGVVGDKAKICGETSSGVCAGASVSMACVAGAWRCDFAAVPGREVTETTCDGLDNDCDGETDEGLIAPANACKRSGVCAALEVPTCAGSKGWDCHYDLATDYEAGVETSCDGKDNNCDGQIDNVGVLTGGASCADKGVCSGGVKIVCSGGKPTCHYAAIAGWEAFESKCDGKDNDCDGETDNLPGTSLSLMDSDASGCKTAGVCAGNSKAIFRTCKGGKMVCSYDALPSYEAAETLCDGKDNDCDGKTDNGLPSPKISPCGDKGLCASGESVCQDGMWRCNWGALTAKGYEAFEATCDGLDNDCDGDKDKLSSSVVPKGCKSKGVCGWGVAASCDQGKANCDYSHVLGYQESTETTCDGLDNDCDGKVDEAEGLDPAPSGCVLGVCAGKAKPTCAGGKWQCAFKGVTDYESDELSCDGKDNDCDGETDEGLHDKLKAKCLNKGVCGAGVTASCVSAKWVCSYGAGFEQAELSCDDKDNDCDGKTDEAACAAGKKCAEDAVCVSGHCAPFFGAGSGSICGAKAGQCALNSGGGELHDSGATVCVDEGHTAKCDAGKWGSATVCPSSQPACVNGACLKCVPLTKACDFSKTKVEQCDAKGSGSTTLKTCDTKERCVGQGACVVNGAIVVADGVDSLERPAVARLGDGFVVIWRGKTVQGRIFDANGKGGEVIAISDKTAPVAGQRVAVAAAGEGFAAAWVVDNAKTGRDIFVRFFNLKGVAVSDELEANTAQAENQEDVAIAGNKNGAVLIWGSASGDKAGKSIRGQRFFPTGKKAGPEFLLNKAADKNDITEEGDSTRPTIAMAADGGFAALWVQKPLGDSTTFIAGRRFDKAGSPTTGNLRMSSSGSEKRRDPAVVWTNGGFLGAWVIQSKTDGTDIELRRFDGALKALGKEMIANTETKGDQLSPALGASPKGGATVVWTTPAAASAGSKTDVVSRDIQANGTLKPASAQVLVTLGALSTGEQLTPGVAVWDDGRVLVTWRDSLTAQSKGGIKATFR